jgi:hypothetical protein
LRSTRRDWTCRGCHPQRDSRTSRPATSSRAASSCPRATARAARVGRAHRRVGHRGRLRQRVPLRRQPAGGAAGARSQRPRPLYRDVLQDAVPGAAPRLLVLPRAWCAVPCREMGRRPVSPDARAGSARDSSRAASSSAICAAPARATPRSAAR